MIIWYQNTVYEYSLKYIKVSEMNISFCRKRYYKFYNTVIIDNVRCYNPSKEKALNVK
jgi:hypothetical protein